MRPFIANVREDGKLRLFGSMAGSSDSKGVPLEFMKSASYCYDAQVHDLAVGPAVDPATGRKRQERPGVVCTIYLPQLYNLDPIGGVNLDDSDAPFHYICMPGAARLAAESNRPDVDNQAIVSHLFAAKYDKVPADKLKTFGAHAALVCAGIDRRLDIPIIHDPRFYAQLVAAFLDAKLASWGCERGSSSRHYGYNREPWGFCPRVSYMEENLAAAGYAPGICVSATRKEAVALIGAETARFERILSGADPDAGAAAKIVEPEAGQALEDDVLDDEAPHRAPDDAETEAWIDAKAAELASVMGARIAERLQGPGMGHSGN